MAGGETHPHKKTIVDSWNLTSPQGSVWSPIFRKILTITSRRRGSILYICVHSGKIGRCSEVAQNSQIRMYIISKNRVRSKVAEWCTSGFQVAGSVGARVGGEVGGSPKSGARRARMVAAEGVGGRRVEAQNFELFFFFSRSAFASFFLSRGLLVELWRGSRPWTTPIVRSGASLGSFCASPGGPPMSEILGGLVEAGPCGGSGEGSPERRSKRKKKKKKRPQRSTPETTQQIDFLFSKVAKTCKVRMSSYMDTSSTT